MWIALVAGIVAAWLLVAVAAALLIGRAVQMADRRRPRGHRAPRRLSAFDRVVQVATGTIPIVRPRVLRAVTGTIPVIRPRID